MFFTKRYLGLQRVISGGQTGADQGGLIAAKQVGLVTGGTAPKGYMTSKGPNLLLQSFGLNDIGTLQTRTKQNVKDSDATVILSGDLSSAGTVLTINLCKELCKPHLVLDIDSICTQFGDTGIVPVDAQDPMCKALFDFILMHQVRTLNVAGNRERFDDLRTTKVTKMIMLNTFQLLNLEDKLLRDSDL